MTRFHHWKSGTAALMAMAITTGAVVPMFTLSPANAQTIFRGEREQRDQRYYGRDVSIPAGVTLPVTYEKDKIVVTPDEKASIKLKVARNVVDRNRNVLIPEGTEVVGRLEPATRNGEKGTRFEAQELVFPNGNRQSLNATSRVITRKETIRKGSKTSTIVQDAAIGAGAASVIALLTGDRRVQALEPILGAGAGAAASILLRKNQAEVVVVEPQDGDLDLTLRSNLVLSRRYDY